MSRCPVARIYAGHGSSRGIAESEVRIKLRSRRLPASKFHEKKEKQMDLYRLPDLPYDYSALEPHVSGKIMELHHDKHHAGYVKNANSALEQLEEAREKEDFARLGALERALAFNLSGHILH